MIRRFKLTTLSMIKFDKGNPLFKTWGYVRNFVKGMHAMMQHHTLSNYKGPNDFYNFEHCLCTPFILQIICYWCYYAHNLIANSSLSWNLKTAKRDCNAWSVRHRDNYKFSLQRSNLFISFIIRTRVELTDFAYVYDKNWGPNNASLEDFKCGSCGSNLWRERFIA